MIQIPKHTQPRIPSAERGITKGVPLKAVLDKTAIEYMARNIELGDTSFNAETFAQQALEGLEALSLMARANHIAQALQHTLPSNYQNALSILMASIPSIDSQDEDLGTGVFYYLPFSSFIAKYGLDPSNNDGVDPFDASMQAQYQLTQSFTAEFSIRPFLLEQQQRTLQVLHSWMDDPSSDVRRLCSEGTRPKLPWGKNIPNFIQDPSPILPILETLKNDESLYVRRSVANSLGDIGKDHPELLFTLCEKWLEEANKELKWVIRHAVRYYAKKQHPTALAIREKAKP